MPNWFYITLEIEGESEELQRFITPVKEKQSILNAYLPMPEELRSGQSPVLVKDDPEAYKREWVDRFNEGRKQRGESPLEQSFIAEHAPKPISPETQQRWIKAYGTDNWYDWAYNAWGTKWDEAALRIVEEEKRLTLIYQLPWSIATGYDQIFAQFPALSFKLRWVEESHESAGAIYWDKDGREEYHVR